MTKIAYQPAQLQRIRDVQVGKDVVIRDFVSLCECTIGDSTKIGTFVEIRQNAKVGSRCKISSHTTICERVTIEDEVFIGHGVVFVKDRPPEAVSQSTSPSDNADRTVRPALVKRGASIGSGAVIWPDVVIGERAMVGAGAVVTESVPDGAIVAGNPARFLRQIDDQFDKPSS